MTDPAVGASTWASGNQVWTGHMGTLTAKDARKARNSQNCMRPGNWAVISTAMSVVPVLYQMASSASSIRIEPASV